MSEAAVGRQGLEGVRPGRDATTGVNASGQSERARQRRTGRGGRGEAPMVPEAEFRSYYGQSIINPPVWEEREIAGYLFLGGLAGASSLMAAGADLTGRPQLARTAKVAAAAAGLASAAALVKDLGRPGRFYNMLRTFKVTSPMSVGSWILGGFIPAAVVAAATDATGLFPTIGALATGGAAVLGPGVATYTAALVADTAVPAWHEGWRQMPVVFAASGTMAAGGAGLVGAPLAQNRPALVMAVAGAAVELSAARRLENGLGLASEAYAVPEAKRLLRASKVLAGLGVGGALVSHRRSRAGSVLSGLALMAASACTRFGIFRAGMASARDPRYTVLPQRQGLDRAAKT